MQINWEQLAVDELYEIFDYIAADNPNAAWRVFDDVKTQINQLLDHPFLGRIGRFPGTRELVLTHTSCVAIYSISGETVLIRRILHTARRWPL